MGRKLDRDAVLERFRRVHGDRYDYGHVEYLGSQSKVEIVCREHGPFLQRPAEHAKGQACPRCARRTQTGAPPQPWAVVEQRLLAVHDRRYTYDGTGYRDTNSKIRATCREHGDFYPQVASHLRGKFGCRTCSYQERGMAKRLTFQDFLKRAHQQFGSRFRYDPWSWDTHSNIGLKKLRLLCPDHGWQQTNPVNHLLSPLGCPACGNLLAGDQRRLTTEEFIARSVARHNGKYTYERATYTNAVDKLTITCPEHGDFSQVASNHMAGHGCPSCSPGGFDPDLPAIVYYIRIHASQSALYKIGITNLTIRERYPYSSDRERITTIREWNYEVGSDAAAHERRVLDAFKDLRYAGPAVLVSVGVSEIFTCDVLGLDTGERPLRPQLTLFELEAPAANLSCSSFRRR